MVARWVVLAVAATGCASIPEAPGKQVLLEVNGTTGEVSTTSDAPIQFAIEFAEAGVRMPQSLFLDGVNRIATGSCPTESGVGIGIYPAFTAVSPGHGGPDATGSLTVTRTGPVVAQIEVDWTVAYQCAGSQEARGTSTFTVFPNGRIVRHDVATPSTTTLTVDGNDCGCSSQTNFFFTTFWAFTSTSRNVVANGGAWTDGTTGGCAVYPNHMIGLAWPDGHTRIPPVDGVSAFVYDWVTDSPTLLPTEQEATTAIILSEETAPASCGNVIADLDDFRITVAGSMVGTDDSGIYVDTRQHVDPVVISTPRRLPKGFAISLGVGDFAKITRDPELPDGWYATQPDGDRTLFWFREALEPSETITIDPR